jgi:hypothetical protein
VLDATGNRLARRAGGAAFAERRQAAYQRLFTASALLGHTADAMRVTVEARSGLKEGLSVMTGQRRPVDPFELSDVLPRDLNRCTPHCLDVWTGPGLPTRSDSAESASFWPGC